MRSSRRVIVTAMVAGLAVAAPVGCEPGVPSVPLAAPAAVRSAPAVPSAPAAVPSAPATERTEVIVRGEGAVRSSGWEHRLTAGRSYAFLSTDNRGRPSHFNRCAPVRYRVNWAGAPRTFRADLAEAMRRLSAASGLLFSYAGSTSVVPYARADWMSRLPRGGADLYISWSDARHARLLAGTVVGYGGHAAAYRPGGREPQISRAGLVLDRNARIPSGFRTGSSMGHVLLHELGHAVNLAHVPDAAQVMHGRTTHRSKSAYQSGDRAGLRRLAGYGCF